MMSCEARIQSMILAHLDRLSKQSQKCFFWRQNTGVASSRGGARIRFGFPGQADITGVARGRRVEIEIKSTDGRQTAEQKAFQSLIEAAGGLYIIARTLEDALAPVQDLLR